MQQLTRCDLMQKREGEYNVQDIALYVTIALDSPAAKTKTKALGLVELTCWLQMHRVP